MNEMNGRTFLELLGTMGLDIIRSSEIGMESGGLPIME